MRPTNKSTECPDPVNYRHSALMKKTLRGHHFPFVNKESQNVIYKRSKLKNNVNLILPEQIGIQEIRGHTVYRYENQKASKKY